MRKNKTQFIIFLAVFLSVALFLKQFLIASQDIGVPEIGPTSGKALTMDVFDVSGSTVSGAGGKYVNYSLGEPGGIAVLTGVADKQIAAGYYSQDIFPPAGVTTLSALASANVEEINLSWSSPGNDGDIGSLTGEFRIQYTSVTSDATNPSFWNYDSAQVTISTSNVTPGSAQSYAPSSLLNNTTYYFRIWAADEILNRNPLSNGATAVTLAAAVTNPQVYAVYETSVTVNWGAVGAGQANSYILQASTDSNFNTVAQSSSTTNISLSTLTVTGLNGGTTYYFRVGSLNHNSVVNYAVDGSTYIAPVYSINIIELTYDFSGISLGVSTISATSVNVLNNGNVTETFSIRATTTTSGSPWFISADGVVDSFNEVALRAVFHTSAPVDADFNPGTGEDLVTESNQASEAALRYTVGGSTTGVNVPSGESRPIWFRLSVPAISSTADSQTIRVYIRGD